jgi:hypothetical protein
MWLVRILRNQFPEPLFYFPVAWRSQWVRPNMLVFNYAQTRPSLKRNIILGNQSVKSSEKNPPVRLQMRICFITRGKLAKTMSMA